jgi:hypothetical protein
MWHEQLRLAPGLFMRGGITGRCRFHGFVRCRCGGGRFRAGRGLGRLGCGICLRRFFPRVGLLGTATTAGLMGSVSVAIIGRPQQVLDQDEDEASEDKSEGNE